jgi:hypothetical protein
LEDLDGSEELVKIQFVPSGNAEDDYDWGNDTVYNIVAIH